MHPVVVKLGSYLRTRAIARSQPAIVYGRFPWQSSRLRADRLVAIANTVNRPVGPSTPSRRPPACLVASQPASAHGGDGGRRLGAGRLFTGRPADHSTGSRPSRWMEHGSRPGAQPTPIRWFPRPAMASRALSRDANFFFIFPIFGPPGLSPARHPHLRAPHRADLDLPRA
jgi:hypothetical protein